MYALTDVLQICFIVDSTLSMQKYVKPVQERVVDTITCVQNKYNGLTIECAVVSYKDGGILPEVLEFTDEPQTVEAHLQNLKYNGGDDFTEDVESGMKGALDVKWTGKYKMVVHITDAPSHGDFYKGIYFSRCCEDVSNLYQIT